LARLELTALLAALLPHLERLRLSEPPQRLESNFINGVRTMPVHFDTTGEARQR
jgi:cytochrome P450